MMFPSGGPRSARLKLYRRAFSRMGKAQRAHHFTKNATRRRQMPRSQSSRRELSSCALGSSDDQAWRVLRSAHPTIHSWIERHAEQGSSEGSRVPLRPPRLLGQPSIAWGRWTCGSRVDSRVQHRLRPLPRGRMQRPPELPSPPRGGRSAHPPARRRTPEAQVRALYGLLRYMKEACAFYPLPFALTLDGAWGTETLGKLRSSTGETSSSRWALWDSVSIASCFRGQGPPPGPASS